MGILYQIGVPFVDRFPYALLELLELLFILGNTVLGDAFFYFFLHAAVFLGCSTELLLLSRLNLGLLILFFLS